MTFSAPTGLRLLGAVITAATAGGLRLLGAVITAATAGGLRLLGAVIGTAVAYLAAVAYFHNQLHQRLSHVPLTDLLLILVALPAIAAGGAWLLSGRQPPAVARQPIE